MNDARWLAAVSFTMDSSLIVLAGRWLSTSLDCLMAGVFQRILT